MITGGLSDYPYKKHRNLPIQTSNGSQEPQIQGVQLFSTRGSVEHVLYQPFYKNEPAISIC